MVARTVSKTLILAIAALAFQLPASAVGAEACAVDGKVSCCSLEPDGKRRGYRYRSVSKASEVCEGYYTRLASSGPVSVDILSYLAGHIPSGKDRVQISAPADDIASFLDERVRIAVRARPRKRGVYYQMDTVLDEFGRREWRLEDVVNRHDDLNGEDALGLVGWIEDKDGEVYVPLRVALSGTDSRDSPKLLARASRQTEEISWSFYNHENRSVSIGNGSSRRKEFEIPLPGQLPGGAVSQLYLEISVVDNDGEDKFLKTERFLWVPGR